MTKVPNMRRRCENVSRRIDGIWKTYSLEETGAPDVAERFPLSRSGSCGRRSSNLSCYATAAEGDIQRQRSDQGEDHSTQDPRHE